MKKNRNIYIYIYVLSLTVLLAVLFNPSVAEAESPSFNTSNTGKLHLNCGGEVWSNSCTADSGSQSGSHSGCSHSSSSGHGLYCDVCGVSVGGIGGCASCGYYSWSWSTHYCYYCKKCNAKFATLDGNTTYTVQYIGPNGSLIKKEEVAPGTSMSSMNVPWIGHTLTGWSVREGSNYQLTQNISFPYVVSKNPTIFIATYTANQYNIAFNKNY